MAPARPEDSRGPVVLGRIGAPFGVQGWVKVQSYTDPPEGIVRYARWELARAGSLGHRAVLDWKRAGAGIAGGGTLVGWAATLTCSSSNVLDSSFTAA